MMSDRTTLMDLWESGRLKQAEEFLRRVWVNMRDCERRFGTATVSIGLKGSGASPNYRVQPAQEIDFAKPVDGSPLAENQYQYLAARMCAFSGISHMQQVTGLGKENWSKLANTIGEIQQLRREIIEQKRPSKKTST